RSAARAQIYQSKTGELYTSTLLAIDSWQKSPSDEAEEILRRNISLLPLPVVQVSQEGNITALELGPDGDTFVTASEDGTACLRNLKDGTEVFCATSSTSMNDAIFAMGGASIVTGDESGIVKVLNAEDGTVEREFAPGSPGRDLDIGPDGQVLSIARANGLITIVDILNTRSKGYDLTLSGRLTVADFSPNGQWMAAGSNAGTVTVWDLNTRKIYSSGRHKGAVLTVRFSPNNRFVISGGADNYAVGFDTQKGEEVFRLLHADWVEDITFPRTGSWFVTASDDARVRIWDAGTGKERLILFQDGAITEVKISSDGKWIAATGADKTVRVWSVYTGVEVLQIPLETNGAVLGFSNDNKYLISSAGSGTISIWDLSGITAPVNFIQFDTLTRISKFTPAGDRLIASDANRVWLLQPAGLTALGARPPGNPVLEFKGDIYDLVISPDLQFIGISTYADEYIIYDLTTRASKIVGPAGKGYAIAFSADSSRFITGTTDGTIETWDVKTGDQISTLGNEGASISSIAASAAGVAAATLDKILIFDAPGEQKISELESAGENQFVAFNSDGSMLASANSSGQVQRWKQTNGDFEALETVKKEQPYSLAFDPQGDLLAVSTLDNVYLLDATTGEELSRIPHKGIVYNVSFSPDETTLATASLKVIQLWDISALQKLRTDDI
ncbi:MAG: WD40 repeat domain-containing protein, partial [Anaerolineales bacterium]